MGANAFALQKIPGFEATDYALLHGSVVWVGARAGTDHPRNLHAPWHPPTRAYSPSRLRESARHVLVAQPKGLMLWRAGRDLPFPWQTAARRFDALADALRCGPADAFAQACVRVLGLGPGLTPCGDDFVGGLMFALHHAPLRDWAPQMADVRHTLHAAARTATNPISAALLDDLMDGQSHRELHALLDALDQPDTLNIEAACNCLEQIGSTSGFDILAGMLTALTCNESS